MDALGRVRSALVIAPHPDDETIGAFGLISRLRRRGAKVQILVISDGAGSHPDLTSPVRNLLVRARMRETVRAMSRSRVSKRNIRFLGLPDRELGAKATDLPRQLRGAIARSGRVDLIVAPDSRDAHGDHRATAFAVRKAVKGSTRLLTYRVWPISRSPQCNGRHLESKICPASKRGAIRSYRSQSGKIGVFGEGFRLSDRDIAHFAHPIERYYLKQ